MYALSFFTLFLLAGPQQNNSDTASSWSGTWQSQTDKPAQIKVENTGDAIHLKEPRDEYTCKINGHDCDFVDEGHKAKVSLWFNGPNLVELRTRGDVIVKRRYALKDGGKTLQVEVIPITPSGKTETIAYSRQP